MNDLQIFSNPEFGRVRNVELNGQPWLVGADVATALGYKNPRKALADHIDPEDKGVTKRDTPGGEQDILIINESGLYSLILSSKMPKAKAFKHWVTSEVLPAIRKNGVYETVKAQQHIEQLEATNERRTAASSSTATITKLASFRPRPTMAKSVTASVRPKALWPRHKPSWTAASTSFRSSPLACPASTRSWPTSSPPRKRSDRYEEAYSSRPFYPIHECP